jgi:hypothetical protein
MARTLGDRFERQVDSASEHHRWLGSITRLEARASFAVDGKLTTAHR